MVFNVHRNRQAYQGRGEGGKGEIIYLSLHCHHQNDSCVQVGSDESHFNVSLIIVRDKLTRQCPQTIAFEEKEEAKQIRTEVPLLTSLTARPNRLTKGDSVVLVTSPHPQPPPPGISIPVSTSSETTRCQTFLSLFSLDFRFYGSYFLLRLTFCQRNEIVRPPYIVSFFQLYELIAYKLQLFDEHITILCIFILVLNKFLFKPNTSGEGATKGTLVL